MDLEIRPFQPPDEEEVVALWRRCELLRPANNPYADIRRKLAVRPELFLVGVADGRIVASVMAGYEGHRGWLNYLAVDPAHRRRGFARSMVEAAEVRLRALGCPKINLQVRSANRDAMEFYRRIGFSVDDALSMGKRLANDEPYA